MLATPMRRILVFTILFACPLVMFPLDIHPDGATMTQDLNVLRSFFPRPEGSTGEKQVLAYITSRLDQDHIPYTPFDFSQSDFAHSFSSNIRVDVAGAIKDTIIVAVPINTPPDATSDQDQSVNIAVALDLLRQLKATPSTVSVTVLFLGAEFGEGGDYPLGSRLFLDDFQPDYPVAVLYLNLRTVPSRVVVHGGGTGIVSPYWLVNRAVTALSEAAVPFILKGDEVQVYRLGLANGPTITDPYLQAGYPAISLEGEYAGTASENPSMWMSAFSSFLGAFVLANSGGLVGDWDRHYLVFQETGGSLILDEKSYVVLLLLVLSGVLLYSLVFRKGLKKYIRTLLRNAWSILPVLAISFVMLAAGTYAIDAVLQIRRFQSLWSYAPLTFLVFKLTVALLLLSALYGPLRKLPFPRNGSFYSAASVLFLLIAIVVVAAINISFSFYFLWAFVFVLAATMVRNRWAKLLLFLPSAFWGVRGMIRIFLLPALPFCRAILLSPVNGNLLISLALLPFVLFIIRLNLIFRGAGLLRRRHRTTALALFFGATVAALAVALLFTSPFGNSRPQPVTVTQTLDDEGTNRVVLDSPAPIGEVLVDEQYGAQTLHVRGDSDLLLLPPQSVPVKVDVEQTEFLQKKNLSVVVSSGTGPHAVSAELTSPQDFVLLDSSLPFVRVSGRDYRLLIGAFPPNPLSLQLTLPAGYAFTLTFTLDLDAPLIGVKIDPKTAKPDTHVHLIKSLSVRT